MSPNAGGGGNFRVWTNEYSFAQGAQINFGDQTPYLTNVFNLQLVTPLLSVTDVFKSDPGLYPAILHPPAINPPPPGRGGDEYSHQPPLLPTSQHGQGWSNVNHGNH